MARLVTPDTPKTTELNWIEAVWQQPIRRVFWMYGVPATAFRGGHHHHSCHMVLHCLLGSVEVYVQTPTTDQYFTLDSADQYLFLDPHDWRLMYRFSPDALLMVFASKPFETTLYYEQPHRPFNVDQIVAVMAERLTRPDTAAG